MGNNKFACTDFLDEFYAEEDDLEEDELIEKNLEKDAGRIKSKSINIKYFYKNEYELYERYFNRRGEKLTGKSNLDSYSLDLDAFSADISCKTRIYYHSEECDESSNVNRQKMYTPKKLYDEKLISNGRYSDWKKYIPDTIIASAFGMETKSYYIQGVEELLECPATCILLLWDCVEIYHEDNIWDIAKKVIVAYLNEEDKVILTDKEKNRITCILLNKQLIWREDAWLDETRCMPQGISDAGAKAIRRHKKKAEKTEMSELRKIFKPKLKQLQKSIRTKHNNDESAENSRKKHIEHNNINDETFYFSPYLSPVVAAICEYWKQAINLFFSKDAIWTSAMPYEVILFTGKTRNDSERLSKNYAVVNHYSKYLNQIELLMGDDEVLTKYETYCNLMINKVISSLNPLKGKERYVQYYVIEQIFGIQLIENIVGLLYEEVKKTGLDFFCEFKGRKMNELSCVLREVWRCSGTITRISLVKHVIRDFLKIANNDGFSRQNEINEIRREISLMDKRFRAAEIITIEEMSKSTNSIKKYMSLFSIVNGNQPDYISEVLAEYMRRENDIKKLQNNGNIRIKTMEEMVKKRLNTKDEQEILIKKWVIKNLIVNAMYPKIEFK